jgi:crotonobetainyl-CoA:carnitine CoA-transferase CaiB-like acyl-CoA transferase
MTELPELPRPLAHLRILDFTNMLSGPYCTRLLSDMGAEVIKIEPPEGDHNRHRRPLRNGHSSFFAHLNAGKKSVVLNLKSARDKAAALKLVEQCDVLVENWRPGVAKRLGLDYDTLSQRNPRLVFCSISGFGQRGPNAQRPAFAPILHAASGYDLACLGYQGGERGDKPLKNAAFVADVLGGMSAFAAIQTALLHRHQTGRGQYIDVALMDCMLNLMMIEVQDAQFPPKENQRVYQPLATQDGYIVMAPTSQRNFEQLAATLQRQDWLTDARFAQLAVREAHWDEFMAEIELWTRQHTSEQCERVLMDAGIPCSRYKTVAEAMSDPHTVARGAMGRVRDAVGEIAVPNAPFQMPGLATQVRAHVPALGEHNRELLQAACCEA